MAAKTHLSRVLYVSLQCFLAAHIMEILLPEPQHCVHMCLVFNGQLQSSRNRKERGKGGGGMEGREREGEGGRGREGGGREGERGGGRGREGEGGGGSEELL